MALMLVGFGLKDSCYEIAELQFADIQFYDGSIYLKEDITEEEREELKALLDDEEQVSGHMNADMQNVTLVNGKKERAAYACVFGTVEDVPKFVDFHDRKTKEQYKLSDDGVIVSEKTAKLLGAVKGDTIEIKDEENGNKKVKIEQICENIWDITSILRRPAMKGYTAGSRNITVYCLRWMIHRPGPGWRSLDVRS